MAYKISLGMLVKVVGMVHITTMSGGRTYERDKYVKAGRPIFGTVGGIYEVEREIREPVVDEETGALLRDEETGEPMTKVIQPAKYTALIHWAGPKHRTSILPLEKLVPAVKNETVKIPE